MPAAAIHARSMDVPAWLPANIWPFETTEIDVDGAAIAVADVGTGPVLLFYTGIGSFIWRDVILRLSADFRCVVLDRPGIGLSASVPRSATTLANSARAVAAVVHELDLRDVTLVVHDTGGPPAIAAAAGTPGRIGGLAGINTFGWKPAGPAFRAITIVRVGFGGFPLGFAAALLGCLLSPTRVLSGLSLHLAVMAAATIARIQGIVLDGLTPYNLALLRPEILLCVLSIVGIVLERRQLRPSTAAGGQ
jgi:pimeloyl-ACP methyl ester carboxylesterase